MLPQIYLIRHGQTEWTKSGQHTGSTDIPLTARGEEEAREVSEWLRGVTFSHAFASPRQRARRTGELAGFAKYEVEPLLAEWDYGDYEGKTSQQIQALNPGWMVFRDGCPGGESPAQVAGRADQLIARLRTLEGNIALFSHGHFGRVFGARWIGLPVLQGRNFLLGTASLSILGYEHNNPEVPAIVLWNRDNP